MRRESCIPNQVACVKGCSRGGVSSGCLLAVECGGLWGGWAWVPGLLAEVAELALSEEVDLDVVDDDARVGLALWVFKAPDFFAGFVGDSDGFAFSGDEVAGRARGFDKDGEAFGWGKLGRVHIGRLEERK
jgi:hypothetical protein